MRAFIVRPFGTQKDIDFDRVERLLIAPALERAKVDGRTIQATRHRLERAGKDKDVWAEVSAADLLCLTSNKPSKVAAAYRAATKDIKDFDFDSVRNQLLIYRDLGLLEANVAETVEVVGALEGAGDRAQAEKPQRSLLFTGHMIDTKERKTPRFPADKEDVAKAAIRTAVEKEMQAAGGIACAFAGAASGGEILFHDLCRELAIPTQLYLPIPPQRYVRSSVQPAGPAWVARFWKIYETHAAEKRVRVLTETAAEVPDERDYLPVWLRTKPNYTIWERNNLWLLFNALAEGGAARLTLIALWDGQASGDGPGGTSDLVRRVRERGARAEVLDTRALLGL